MKKEPNFLIVGAPKAGTTSIAHYLKEHPEVFIPREKEPFYFLPNILDETSQDDPMYNAIKQRSHLSEQSYYGLFEDVCNEKKIGEATVHYLYHYNDVIPKVRRELGDVQIIIVLRNPITRAFSNYKFQKGQLATFERALELEEVRRRLKYNSLWYYKDVGRYFLPVKAYMENFSRVHVCFFEDLVKDAASFMKEVYRFLEVDDEFLPRFDVAHNSTIVPRNQAIRYIVYFRNKVKFRVPLPRPIKEGIRKGLFKNRYGPMKSETYMALREYFKEDVLRLEKLLNKDLSSWYS